MKDILNEVDTRSGTYTHDETYTLYESYILNVIDTMKIQLGQLRQDESKGKTPLKS